LKHPDNPLNRVFFLYSVITAYMCLTDFQMRVAESFEVSHFWFRIGVLWHLILPAPWASATSSKNPIRSKPSAWPFARNWTGRRPSSDRTRAAHARIERTIPGEHVFLARAENWSYVRADLEAGKKYYILTNVGMGVWKARVYLIPVTKKQDKYTQANINEWKAQFTPISLDPNQLEAYRSRRVAQIKAAAERCRSGNSEAMILERDDYFD
jgi:hypothetical protein